MQICRKESKKGTISAKRKIWEIEKINLQQKRIDLAEKKKLDDELTMIFLKMFKKDHRSSS